MEANTDTSIWGEGDKKKEIPALLETPLFDSLKRYLTEMNVNKKKN
jgi:hypothetical protein